MEKLVSLVVAGSMQESTLEAYNLVWTLKRVKVRRFMIKHEVPLDLSSRVRGFRGLSGGPGRFAPDFFSLCGGDASAAVVIRELRTPISPVASGFSDLAEEVGMSESNCILNSQSSGQEEISASRFV